jgi:2-dehydro-3-deoxygluconokinase
VRGALGAVGEGLFEIGLDEGEGAPLRRGYGGDVANVCVMAARTGATARLAGRVGDDALGRALLTFWQNEGVETGHVHVDPEAPTGIYVNERTRNGTHRFDYHRRGSAGSRLAPEDLPDAFFDGLGVLHTSGISLAVAPAAAEAGVARARATGAAVSFAVNHRAALGGDPETVLAAALAADVVFVSTEEAASLLGTASPDQIPAALGNPTGEVVVTAGDDGAVVALAGEATAVPAPRVEAVDAAGAGDALAGAYLAARLNGLDPTAALCRGVVASALSCRSFGCALSYPDAGEVEAAVAGPA